MLKYNYTTGDYELLRDPDVPLTMNSRGSGGDAGPKVLANGKIYMYGAYEYRDSDATRGLFEWDGEKWLSIVQGLKSQTVIRDDYAGFGPLYTDRARTRLLVKATGYFEKVAGGWLEFWENKYGWNIFPEKDFTYLYSRWGGVRYVYRAIRRSYTPGTPDCMDRIREFAPSVDNTFILAELSVDAKNADGSCRRGGNPYYPQGIYRFNIPNPEDDSRFNVSNLHIKTGNYVGNQGIRKLQLLPF